MKSAATTFISDVSPGVAEFEVEAISDYRSFLEMESDWNDLLLRAGIDHPFLTHEWVRAWWNCFGAGRTLHIVTVRCGGELIAIAPMMLRKGRIYGFEVRILEFIYNEHTERFDFVVADYPQEAYRQIWSYFVKQRHLWDVIRLCQLPSGSRTLDEITRLASEDRFLTGVWHSCDAPYVKVLSGKWDSYFHSLRAKLRANLRRRLRGLAELGEVDHEVVRSGDRVRTALEEGLRIEEASWKGYAGTAMRSTPEVRSFYTQIAEIGAKRNWLWLDFLTVGGRRIAFDYCLRYRNKQYLLKTGYDPKYARYSPYHLLLSRVLQTTFENRLAEFDFLGINDSWKQPWTSAARPHYWLYVFPNDIRMRLLYGIKFQMLPRLKQHRFIAALRGLRADRGARDDGN